MSNTIENQIHWSSHTADELVTLPDNTLVYFLNHVPHIDVDPKDYIYAVITVKKLLQLIVEYEMTFSKHF